MQLLPVGPSDRLRNRHPEILKKFAFSIFDDMDEAQVATAGPIYDFLRDLGYRTTKPVWPCRAVNGLGPEHDGVDCEDPEYLK